MNFPIKTIEQLRPFLLAFRKEAGLTQAALAERLGITQQSYAALEAHPEVASFERVFKVLRLLGVEIVLADAAGSRQKSLGEGVVDQLARAHSADGPSDASSASQRGDW